MKGVESLDQKITVAAAAPAMAEEEEEVEWAWSWGAGTDGQLGTGTLQDQHLPQPLRGLPSAAVAHIACGGAHAIALTVDGRVLAWGRGTRGQLGHGKLDSFNRPEPLKFFENIPIGSISAGWNHSGFVTDTGRLYMCGDGSFGQIGLGNNQSYSWPQEVSFSAGEYVKQVACGMRHSLVLLPGSSSFCVYGFGSGRHGQIGQCLSGKERSLNVPKGIRGFDSCDFVSIHANGDHSAALSADGQLYIWGRQFNGNVGDHRPRIVPARFKISHVALGWNHAIVISDEMVYMIGGRHHGMLTASEEKSLAEQEKFPSNSLVNSTYNGMEENPVKLERVPYLDAEKVTGIAAGSEHSALVTEKGTIMTWGWGEHGQLGLGNTLDKKHPQEVNINLSRHTDGRLSVYCGSGFTVVANLVQ